MGIDENETYGKSELALSIMKTIERIMKEDKPIIINIGSRQRMGMSCYSIQMANAYNKHFKEAK